MVDFVQTYHELVDRKRDPLVWESNLDYHIHLLVGTVTVIYIFYCLIENSLFSGNVVDRHRDADSDPDSVPGFPY
jgi:hypothetical protein